MDIGKGTVAKVKICVRNRLSSSLLLLVEARPESAGLVGAGTTGKSFGTELVCETRRSSFGFLLVLITHHKSLEPAPPQDPRKQC